MANSSGAKRKVSPSDPAKKSKGATNGDQLDLLQKMFPNKNGMRLLAPKEKRNRNARAATLWVYIESRGTFELHESVLGKRDAKSSVWWSRFMAGKVFDGTHKNTDRPVIRLGVLNGAIIPGVNRKTRRQWSIRAVIGYNLHDNLNAIYTALHTRRNKTKR